MHGPNHLGASPFFKCSRVLVNPPHEPPQKGNPIPTSYSRIPADSRRPTALAFPFRPLLHRPPLKLPKRLPRSVPQSNKTPQKRSTALHYRRSLPFPPCPLHRQPNSKISLLHKKQLLKHSKAKQAGKRVNPTLPERNHVAETPRWFIFAPHLHFSSTATLSIRSNGYPL